MNDNDYKEALFHDASIFNEHLGADFSEYYLVLRCFQTDNQQEVFEQFCKQYFPDRLEDRYTDCLLYTSCELILPRIVQRTEVAALDG